MMWYLKKMRKTFGVFGVTVLAYNLYFLLLLPELDRRYLYYLDMLLLVVFLSAVLFWYQKEKQKKSNEEEVYQEVDKLKRELESQFEQNADLQDYIAKWCHEVKIPLAALLLMNEQIENASQREMMQEQLERIRQYLNGALTGCRIQGNFCDLQIKKTDLKACVKESIQNNSFFLIQKRFEIEVDVADFMVYTDKEWIVYVLDQIISNAVKYASEHPKLSIRGTEEAGMRQLLIEDNGEGIQESDLKNVFEKGFTGSNHHNGKYKSTGMGLYLTKMILKKLGHTIEMESEYGRYTKVILVFQDNREYFQL